MKEINKIVQELKMEIKAINKTQMEGILEMENLGKRTGIPDAGITKRIQKMGERITDIEETIEEINTSVTKKCYS